MLQRSDIVVARQIIKRTTKAQEIAATGSAYEGAMKAEGHGAGDSSFTLRQARPSRGASGADRRLFSRTMTSCLPLGRSPSVTLTTVTIGASTGGFSARTSPRRGRCSRRCPASLSPLRRRGTDCSASWTRPRCPTTCLLPSACRTRRPSPCSPRASMCRGLSRRAAGSGWAMIRATARQRRSTPFPSGPPHRPRARRTRPRAPRAPARPG